jgi:hypothetical protein
MIRIPRWVVGVLGVLFALFHAGLGISNIQDVSEPRIAIIALAIYLATVLPTIILYRNPELPIAQALINLAAAALIPLLVHPYIEPETTSAYSTWYVMGVATLMAATAVRQQKIIAWAGTLLLAFQVVAWAGIGTGIQTGLLGALMLVFAGHAISVGLAKAYKDTMLFTNEALEIEKQKISNAVASEVRRSKLEAALNGALPILNLIKANHGKLSDQLKIESRLLEAELRDEIRGRDLLSDSVRSAVKAARVRGVEVIILDEGGVGQLDAQAKHALLGQAVDAINKVKEGRITFRAPVGESWNATLVATRPGIAKPDIWLKLK